MCWNFLVGLSVQRMSADEAETMRARSAALVLIVISAVTVAPAAPAQEIEAVFLAALEGEGYYVANGGVARLEVAALANLAGERPVSIGARLEVKKRYYGEQIIRYVDTAALVRAGGRRDSSGLDRWYLPGVSWAVSCSHDGHTVSVNGERVAKSPVDFIIQVGIAIEPEKDENPADAAMELARETIAESRKTRIVCGKYSPLPKL